jgi:hypothetical protein
MRLVFEMATEQIERFARWPSRVRGVSEFVRVDKYNPASDTFHFTAIQ